MTYSHDQGIIRLISRASLAVNRIQAQLWQSPQNSCSPLLSWLIFSYHQFDILENHGNHLANISTFPAPLMLAIKCDLAVFLAHFVKFSCLNVSSMFFSLLSSLLFYPICFTILELFPTLLSNNSF